MVFAQSRRAGAQIACYRNLADTALAGQRRLWAREFSAAGAAKREAILRQFDTAVAKTYGRYDIVLSHGKGREVWDVNGTRYLDMGGGIAVNALGHCHPEVIETVVEQMSKLGHCSNLYYTQPQAELGTSLAELFAQQGGYSGKLFFCNSGVCRPAPLHSYKSDGVSRENVCREKTRLNCPGMLRRSRPTRVSSS
jgi:hypothetical protein